MESSRQRGHGPIVLESLENRALFSQILVSTYGAAPNDARDDRAAVQAAFSAARAGDTITFSDGVYNFSAFLPLKSGVNVTSAKPQGALLDFKVSRDGNG